MKPLRLAVMLVPMERPLALTSYIMLLCHAVMQPEPTQDSFINHTVPAVSGKVKTKISLTPGGRSNLYSLWAVQRAGGLAHKIAVSKGVYTPGRERR